MLSLSRFRRVVLVGVLVLASFSMSWAWEFKVNQVSHVAQMFNLYQTGANGFFGPYNVDNEANGTQDRSNLNFWWGYTIVSGSSARAAWQIFYAEPELKINNALSIKGDMWIGPQVNGGVINGAYVPAAITVYGTGWVEANLPIGTLSYGKMPFGQGCGLQFAATTVNNDMTWYGRTFDGLDLKVPYGPFTFHAGVTPYTIFGSSLNYLLSTLDVNSLTAGAYDPFDTSGQNIYDFYVSAAYAAGNFEAGVGTIYKSSHVGPEGTILPTAAIRASVPPSDTETSEGWAYFKYTNGRLFANAEADWFYQTIRYQRSLNGTFNGTPPLVGDGSGRNLFAPRYMESWRYMTEFGALCGPAKLSFLYANLPGGDRRHGILINKQSFLNGPDQTAAVVFRPYAIIMPAFYHGGVISFFDLNDAQSLAARLDYAVAANLDLSVSVLKAKRLSKATVFGQWSPTWLGVGVAVPYANNTDYGLGVARNSVPDDDLGTEVDLSIRWKLLENWMVKGTWGMFWPGKWWNYACVDKSVPSWDAPTIGNLWGTNPNRTIDPVGMLRVELWTSF